MLALLMNLKHPLQKGNRFPPTLDFEKTGRIEIQVLVLSIGATGHP